MTWYIFEEMMCNNVWEDWNKLYSLPQKINEDEPLVNYLIANETTGFYKEGNPGFIICI